MLFFGTARGRFFPVRGHLFNNLDNGANVRVLCIGILALCLESALSAFAANSTAPGAGAPQVSGYVNDRRGQALRSGFGLCWRTGYWTPAMATPECDPDLVPKKPIPAAAPATPPRAARAAARPAPRPAAKPTPVSEKVSLSADTLFDFDKAIVRADGKSKLDELVARIKGADLDTVIVVGHTDRIGSNSYNMKLSLRRADAAKAYLASKGIAANRIHTEGRGEKQPKTKPGQCKGPKSPKLIACLQPDRRVEIEIVGSRTK